MRSVTFSGWTGCHLRSASGWPNPAAWAAPAAALLPEAAPALVSVEVKESMLEVGCVAQR